ncbi:MAG: hypothetical protein ACP5N1_01225 [Candidatus Woesearchaeota archaeon]
MSNFKKTLKKLVAITAVIATMYSPVIAQTTKTDSTQTSKPQIEMTLNAKTDVALTSDLIGALGSKTDVASTNNLEGKLGSRTEAWINGGIDVGGTKFAYDGVHMINGFQLETYFGNSTISITEKDAEVGFCTSITTTKEGVIDAQYGLINKTYPKKLGADFGSIRMTANKDKANLTFLVGKNFGKGYSGFVWCNTTKPYQGQIKNITWVEFDKKLTSHISGYVRGEVTDAKLANTMVLLGIYLNK